MYGILSVYIPWSVVLGIVLPAFGIIAGFFPAAAARSFFFAVLPAAAFISGAAASLYFSLTKNSRENHAVADLRGGIAAAAAAYLIISLPLSVPWERKFFPGLVNTAAFLSALFVWFGTLSLRRAFAGRELPERHMREYDGDRLRGLMLEDAPLIAESDLRLSSWRLGYGTALALSWLLTVISAALGRSFSPFSFVLFVCVTVTAFWIFAFLGSLKQEHYFAGEGISGPRRAVNSAAMFVFLASAALPSVFLASGGNVFPLSVITGFFEWLRRLFTRIPRESARPSIPFPDFDFAPPPPFLPPQFVMEGESRSPPWPGWDLLKKGALFLLIFLFVCFMIKPLFNLKSHDGTRLAARLRRIVSRWLSRFRTAAGSLLMLFCTRNNTAAARKPGTPARRIERGTAYSPVKKQAMRKNMGIFARLIIWGNERYRITWKASLAPGEYCALLAGAAANAGTKGNTADAAGITAESLPVMILRCGELFEEALYAPAVFPAGKEREFKKTAEKIME
jgi:hypothetical protein